MRIRYTLIMVGALAVLAACAIFIFGLLPRISGGKKDALLFPGFNPDEALSILIKDPSREQTLRRVNGEWKAANYYNYPADPQRVGELLRAVKDLRRASVVSRNPAKRAIYQVGEGGLEVRVMGSDDKTLAHLLVGKPSPDFTSTYIRRADSDEVIAAGGLIKSAFDRGEWRDRTIFDFNPDDASGLALTTGKDEIFLTRDGDNWKMVKPSEGPARAGEVISIVRAMSSLKADDFASPEEREKAGLDKPSSKATVALKDGGTRTLLIGKDKDAQGSYVRREDKATVFVLSRVRINGLLKKADDLKEK